MTWKQRERPKHPNHPLRAILPQWICNDPHDPQVCRSNAGYYIGTVREDRDTGCEMPYARYTTYMTEEEAEALLESGDWVYIVRQSP